MKVGSGIEGEGEWIVGKGGRVWYEIEGEEWIGYGEEVKDRWGIEGERGWILGQ